MQTTIDTLRGALLDLLNAPVGHSRGDLGKRNAALARGHRVYCDTAPDWQKDKALRLAQIRDPGIATYDEAVSAFGRSLLRETDHAAPL